MKHAFTVMTYDHGSYTNTWASIIIPVPEHSVSSDEMTEASLLQFMVFPSRVDAVNHRKKIFKGIQHKSKR